MKFLATASLVALFAGTAWAEDVTLDVTAWKGNEAGVQAGPAASAGVDFNVGYHTAKSDGTSGPKLEVALEVKAAVGGGYGGGWDLAKAAPQFNVASIGVGPVLARKRQPDRATLLSSANSAMTAP